MRLRTSIGLRELSGGAVAVADAATGLQLSLSPDAIALVRRMLAAGDAALPPESDEVAAFFGHLGEIGLARDLSEAEAARRQAAFILSQAAARELDHLTQTLGRAVRVSSFHRGRLQPLLAALTHPADLQRLPLMTKDDLRAQFPEGLVDVEEMRAGLEQGELLFASTSGSTGERLQVVSDTRLPRFPTNFAQVWDVGTFAEGYTARTAVFTSPVCAGPVCHLGLTPMEGRVVGGATLYLNSSDDIFSLDRALASNIEEELARFAPDFLFVNPVYLSVLVRHLLEHGRSLPRPRAIVSCYQFLSQCQRRLLTEAFGCPIYDLYSATDLGGSVIASGCRLGGLHVRLDQVFLEIERGGQALGPEELGRVVVTTHHPSMPLVRYLVGDVARWAGSPCACELGSDEPRLHLEGRTRDVLRVQQRWVTPRDVDLALSGVEGIAFYQLTELDAGRFELALVPSLGGLAPSAQAAEALGPLLGGAPAVRTVRRLRAEKGQKFRLTVPRVEHPELVATEGHP